MSLLQEAVALSGHAGGQCPVGRLMEQDKKLAQELQEALDAPDASAKGISDALNARGIDLGRQQIYRHRKRYCRCAS